MSEVTKIVVDAMGGDNAPEWIIKGAVEAVNEGARAEIVLTGDEKKIKSELAKYSYEKNKISVVGTTEEITCHDAPVQAVRTKKDSSLVVGMNMVKNGEADAIISAGSSGAVLAGGQLIVGRSKGVKRTPLAPLLPTSKGFSLLIDCGANVDARPEHLVQFAKMGSIYMENIEGIKNPRVAIVNIGDEEEKGNALVKETYPLLKECKDINFIGSIEAREIPNGAADVIVCEAFVGNVILKLYEGLAKMILGEIKKSLMSSLKSKIGALLIKSSLKGLVKTFNAKNKGGAPLLGLKGLVVKIHGNSKNEEVKSAIFQCVNFHETGVSEKISEKISADITAVNGKNNE
jgi:glycerol-3-phosphate acyltransferase PlsX